MPPKDDLTIFQQGYEARAFGTEGYRVVYTDPFVEVTGTIVFDYLHEAQMKLASVSSPCGVKVA